MELTGEISSITNDINNYLAQIVNPTGLQDVDCIIEEEGEYMSAPGRVNLVKLPAGKTVQQVFSWFTPPPLPQELTQFVSYLEKQVSKVTGLNAPGLGAQGSGKRSATEQRQQSAAAATRTGLAVLYYRFFLRESINYIHKLYLQYDLIPETGVNVTTPNGQEMTVTREMLAKDYTIDISGISDPNDQSTERNAMITLAGIAMKNPDIMGNPVHRRNFYKVLFDKWQWPNSDDIVGTQEEAKGNAQAQAQQAQQQKLAGAVGTLTGNPPKPGGES
jgi:hypothetical protein